MEVPLAGVDVVEVAPAYDHAEITAFLANRVVLEVLSGITWRRKRQAGPAGADPALRVPESPLLDRPVPQAGRSAPPAGSPGPPASR